MWAVMKKELKSYFYSPIGYVFIGLFLAIFSFIFYITTISQGAVTYQYVFFYSVMYIVIFLIPLLTMRTFAEERKNGTEQILMTAPRSAVAIVLGKFLAALVVIAITELFTLINKKILKNKKMLISTNLSLPHISKRYSERISSRIIGEFKLFKFFAEDIRIQLNLKRQK